MSQKSNYELYSEYWAEINKRELSNSENFDKAILSLSSAGLALSITFIKFVVPIEQIRDITFLYCTWILFAASIIFTIISFLVSQKALRVSLDYADKCFNQNKNDFCNKKSIWARCVSFINYITSTLFIFAIISVIIFTTQNIKIQERGYSKMSDKKTQLNEGASVPRMQSQVAMDGASVPQMMSTSSSGNTTRGASVPQMQPQNPSIGNATNGANVPTMQPTQPTEKGTSGNKEE